MCWMIQSWWKYLRNVSGRNNVTQYKSEEMLEEYKYANPFDLVSTQLCPLEEKNIELIGIKEMYDKYLK